MGIHPARYLYHRHCHVHTRPFRLPPLFLICRYKIHIFPNWQDTPIMGSRFLHIPLSAYELLQKQATILYPNVCNCHKFCHGLLFFASWLELFLCLFHQPKAPLMDCQYERNLPIFALSTFSFRFFLPSPFSSFLSLCSP